MTAISAEVTEIKYNQGKTVVSPERKDTTVSTPVLNASSQEEKDYNQGLVTGVLLAFEIREDVGLNKIKVTSRNMKSLTAGKSDAYVLFIAGIHLGSDFGVAGVGEDLKLPRFKN